MSTARWETPPSSATPKRAEPELRYRCTELWHRIDADAGRLTVARTTWHATADLARARAAERNAQWAAGTLVPEPGAYDYVAEGPPIGATPKRAALQAIAHMRDVLRGQAPSSTDNYSDPF